MEGWLYMYRRYTMGRSTELIDKVGRLMRNKRKHEGKVVLVLVFARPFSFFYFWFGSMSSMGRRRVEQIHRRWNGFLTIDACQPGFVNWY